MQCHAIVLDTTGIYASQHLKHIETERNERQTETREKIKE